MNENSESSRDLTYLMGLARRLQSNTEYMAWVLHEYQRQERLDDHKLAAALRLDNTMLTRLSLCKRPNSASPAFAHQVRQLSEYVGIDIAILASVLRQVESLSALTNLPAQQPEAEPKSAKLAFQGGILAAARDRAEEGEVNEPDQAEEADQDDSADSSGSQHVD